MARSPLRERAPHRYGWRILAGAAGAVAVVVAMRGRIPDPAAVMTVLSTADWRWMAAAVVAQMLSQAAFARQQRTLLAAYGVVMSRRDALSITYSRTAMTALLPGGSAVSAAFALREYKRQGASTATATASTVLSGVASVAGLLLISPFAVRADRLMTVATVTVLSGAVIVMLLRSPLAGPVRRSRWWPRVRDFLTEASALRPRHVAAAVAYAVLNWLFDLACLIAVAQACGLQLSLHHLASAYLTVQLVRQIPLSPGGIGLIEAALLAGLVTSGAPQATAAAVVLGYRLVSFWLMLPKGLAGYLRLTRLAPAPAPA